jgi:hypothetical protein
MMFCFKRASDEKAEHLVDDVNAFINSRGLDDSWLAVSRSHTCLLICIRENNNYNHGDAVTVRNLRDAKSKMGYKTHGLICG